MRHPTKTEDGVITAFFVHRFMLRRHDGSRLLADLGPKGVEAFPLVEGREVSIEGDAKPSELKVSSITRKGGERVAIRHRDPRDDKAAAAAKAAVLRVGLAPSASRAASPNTSWFWRVAGTNSLRSA
jgi:hypothetical protein